ncbi:MAG: PfkB family carbohydrate kinase [Myxococcota bacterium]|nr:PfkB family carbohydrate kinase [Myxococcota bacterium]
MSLLVVGSVAYDSVQTPHGGRDDVLGGSATFFSVAASRLTTPSIVAVVGEDFRAEDMELLDSRGVNTSGIERAQGETFRWRGRYHDDMKGRDTLSTELNVFEHFNPVLSQEARDTPFLFLANIHPSLQQSVLEQMTCPHFVAADTMNFWIEGARDELIEVLSRVDGFIVNDEEAIQLTGADSMNAAARAIQQMGPDLVVIKRGEFGALVYNQEDVFFVPALPLDTVMDPTGAGDTFAGGFMGLLAATGDFTPDNVRRAAVVGSLMAAYSVEGFSLDGLLDVTKEDITRRYEQFAQLVSFPDLTL